MYYLISLYCCSYLSIFILKEKIPPKNLFVNSCIVLGSVNFFMFLFIRDVTVLSLVVYILNLILSGVFFFFVKDYTFDFKDRDLLLYNISIYITVFLTLVFSILNILEYYEFFQRFNIG